MGRQISKKEQRNIDKRKKGTDKLENMETKMDEN